jgi:hypothetical protein
MIILKCILYLTATFGKTVSQFWYGNLHKEELGRIVAITNSMQYSHSFEASDYSPAQEFLNI